LNCVEIRGRGWLFVAKKNTQGRGGNGRGGEEGQMLGHKIKYY